MKTTIAVAAIVTSLCTPSSSYAADPQLGRNLAATCANCHGTDGRSVGGIDSLAGQPKDTLVRKMTEFRNGSRPTTIMHQIAKGYTEQQIDLIAAYFAARQ